MTNRKGKIRRRGVLQQIIDGRVLEAHRLDVVLFVGLSMIGISVRRMAPDLVWAYAGALLLLVAFAIGKAQAKQQSTKGD
jgi:hypothetical protein